MGTLWVSAIGSFGAAVLALAVVVIGGYSLIGHLHERLTQALGQQISIESGRALRDQLRGWLTVRIRVLVLAAMLMGSFLTFAIGAVVFQLLGK